MCCIHVNIKFYEKGVGKTQKQKVGGGVSSYRYISIYLNKYLAFLVTVYKTLYTYYKYMYVYLFDNLVIYFYCKNLRLGLDTYWQLFDIGLQNEERMDILSELHLLSGYVQAVIIGATRLISISSNLGFILRSAYWTIGLLKPLWLRAVLHITFIQTFV